MGGGGVGLGERREVTSGQEKAMTPKDSRRQRSGQQLMNENHENIFALVTE